MARVVPLVAILVLVVLAVSTTAHGLTREEICRLPKDKGPCKANASRYFFNSATGRCELFQYGNCEGNANNFVTEELCWKFCGSN
ncbi:kappaPI-actitoxin-Avd3c-like [Panulirus ornatus]|uniref:kappaPI-actitoxin-Avd3c-like n=1 Tax=Panulirus ornatus TaxID=150431 RepID=UPI003A849B91